MKKTITEGFEFGRIGSAEATGRCVNLISERIEGKEQFVVAPEPVMVSDEGWQPWHTHRGLSESYTFFHSPSAAAGISRIGVSAGGGEIAIVGVAEGSPSGGVSPDAVSVSFTSGQRRRELRLEGTRWRLMDLTTAIMPRAVPRVNDIVVASTGQVTLSGISASSPTLTTSHINTLTERLTSCYRTLAANASGEGMWIQPMLIVMRLTDANGVECGVTQPLLMAPSGWQCTDELQLMPTLSESTMTIGDLRLECEGYVIDIEFPAGIAGRASCAEVWALPQQHTLDSSMSAPTRFYSRSDGWHLDTAVPGATIKFGSREVTRSGELMECAPHVKSAGSCIGRFDLKACEGSRVTLRATGNDIGEWEKKLSACRGLQSEDALSTERRVLSGISAGAEFSAEAVACGGDSIVWGNIRVNPVAELPPTVFMLEGEESELWQAAVEVTMATGAKVVRHFEGTGSAPLRLLPLVSYPSRNAMTWRMIVENESAGTRRSITLPLTAAGDGSQWAGYLATDLSAVTLTESTEAFPAESTGGVEEYPSMILLSKSSAPLRPIAALSCSAARIDGILPAVRQRSAWDARQSRFVVITPDGINGLNAGASTGYLGISNIDRLQAKDVSAVASTPFGVVIGSGRRLLSCTGNSVRHLYTMEREIGSLAWHVELGRLLSLDSNGNVWMLETADDGSVLRCSLLPLPYTPTSLIDDGGGNVWLPTGDALMRMERRAGSMTAVEVSSTLETGLWRRVCALTVRLSGSRIDGTITLRGGSRGGVITVLNIHGAVRHPITMRIAAPVRSRLTFELRADVTSDFRFSGAEVTTIKTREPR